ncbi:MAG: tRNA (adenosine(37)-N6)-threonylcarbamoyltransferase complex dimerization subunit type 1 TsaB [Ruminococcaceae bacterium]|nr:tRNA (adenosine(37)-N6)-threonylcarbamoyltransferase complex dimerization subunit type 1 TsaB [Oscillospiraceae bacterium]
MIILALESSAVAASAAVCKDGQIISEAFLNIGLTHSQTLLPLARNALSAANLKVSDVDIFAVSYGPGSFTGIRIGVAAAKGMAFANNKPCYGISTLEAMAWTVSDTDALICPVMDARCMQVYTALFACKNNQIERITADDAVKIDELANMLQAKKHPILLLGDGAEKYYTPLHESGLHVTLASEAIRQQHASGTALAAWARYKNGIVPIESEKLVPCYLRLSQAERERQNKEKGEQKQ